MDTVNGKNASLCLRQVVQSHAQIKATSSQIFQMNMAGFEKPQLGQPPVAIGIPKALHGITVRHGKEQPDQHIVVVYNGQEFNLSAVVKCSQSDGWLSRSIASIISSLVGGGGPP